MKLSLRFLRRGVPALLIALCMVLTIAPVSFAASVSETSIVLSDSGVKVDGASASTSSASAVYVGASIVYYHDGTDAAYGAGTSADMHTAAEAAAQTVVTITKAGTYRISGTLSAGQLAVDLGDSASTDPTAVVTLIFDGASITCKIAPAVIFYNVYECNNGWSTDTATSTVDTTAAGANVVIADGSTNNITGSHVAKIYKTSTTPKIKYDGAFYSCMSMNITGGTLGTGVLNITADNEGLDSELHLTINGGNVNIWSQDDGINTNEDGVSVTTINGGTLHICAGLGSEGDGVDSNGWLVINGGTVIATANPASDSGLDSDKGSYVNGGTVVALGSTMDWAESDSKQVTMNLQFAAAQNQDEAIVITDEQGKVVFAYDPDQDEVTGSNIRRYQGAVISCSALTVGKTYFVWLGGTITGTDVKGVYDVSTVTAYTGGTKQMYTGTDVGNIFGGAGGMTPPTNADGTTTPPTGSTTTPPTGTMTPPSGSTTTPPTGTFTPPTNADGTAMTPPTNADGTTTPPTMPSGTQPQMPGGQTGTASSSATASVYFYLSDKVNAFSGVTDYADLSYTDVKSSDWYYAAVSYTWQHGLMSGTAAKTFSPNEALTRATVVTTLYRLAGSPAVTATTTFSDVASGSWYANAVAWAVENGIVDGYEDGTFRPDAAITREETAAMVYRYAKLKGYDLTAVSDLAAYTDAASVQAYAADAMKWAVGTGLIKGDTTTTLTPAATADRAQLATILMRFGNWINA